MALFFYALGFILYTQANFLGDANEYYR